MAGSLLGLPDAFLVAFIRDPRADATSLAAFSNICCKNTRKKRIPETNHPPGISYA